MRLLVFDVDGTLTHTAKLDATIYSQSIKSVFSIDIPATNRTMFRTSTDSGIIREIIQSNLNRSITLGEERKFKNFFFENLRNYFVIEKNIGIAGVNSMFNTLRASNACDIAIATGGWSISANLKLSNALLQHEDLPKATADDSIERIEIISKSIARAKTLYKRHYKDIIYVGDRLWDYKAAQALNLGFIGVGNDEELTKCFDANHIVSDYLDSIKFLDLALS